MRERGWLSAVVWMAVVCAAGAVRAADIVSTYPSRPIRIIAPTTPGARSAWRAFNLLAGPALLLAFGGLRQLWLRRRAREGVA